MSFSGQSVTKKHSQLPLLQKELLRREGPSEQSVGRNQASSSDLDVVPAPLPFEAIDQGVPVIDETAASLATVNEFDNSDADVAGIANGVPASPAADIEELNGQAAQGNRTRKKWPSIFKKAASAVKSVAKNAANAAKNSIKNSVSNAWNNLKERGINVLGGGGGKKEKVDKDLEEEDSAAVETVPEAEEGEEVVDADVAEVEVEAGAVVVVAVEEDLTIGLQLPNSEDWLEKAKSNN